MSSNNSLSSLWIQVPFLFARPSNLPCTLTFGLSYKVVKLSQETSLERTISREQVFLITTTSRPQNAKECHSKATEPTVTRALSKLHREQLKQPTGEGLCRKQWQYVPVPLASTSIDCNPIFHLLDI